MRTGAALDNGIDERSEPREEVLHRTRAIGEDGSPVGLTIVNVSAGGMMARADRDYLPGDVLRLTLPHAGVLTAQVRWSLGGRIGCRFVATIPIAAYYAMLALLRR